MQHFKKLLAILLCALFIFTVVACDSGKDPVKTDPSKPAESGDPVDTDKPDDPVKPDDPDKLSLENIKIGFVHITDPSDMGYTYNHDLGTQKMQKELGLKDDQIINKFNTSEDETCENALRELAEQGCHIIFATSFGFEDYVIKVAKDYPDIEFCHATGYKAASAGLDNVHNYFGKIYQARYLSGIAAGLKTEKNKLGYVGAFPFPEVISGFTAFYLGAKSVNPDVKMTVKYTHSWNNPTLEAQLAQALIDEGCDVLGQHCDSTAPATAAEAAGVFHVGYNSDMRDAAPNASLTSAVWDWSRYLVFAINKLIAGEEIPVDWGEGLAEGVCDVSPLNDAIVAPDTAAKIEEARAKIVSGDWDVFTGPLVDVRGETVVAEGETFIEPASAPSWGYILEGIDAQAD
ncbi:MAG TPA: BMP family ABC transporter substrate-binding protein [Clostridiaceae bacterium]|nr:BMP family ABC transporter substrate-binding protein [Clostridiaceae bacterium]